MRILLDNNVDRRFADLLQGHETTHAREIGWAELQNGELISRAEREGYDVLVTADKQMQYQQNLSGKAVSVIVLGSVFVDFLGIAPLSARVLFALENLPAGSFTVVTADSAK